MIKVKDVSYAYHSGETIQFPDFEVLRGEHCLLLGESGSGKTTLLHLIGGLLRGHQGQLKLNDTELASLSESSLDQFRGKNIGFIFQKSHLISALTVEKNLALSPYLAGLTINKPRIESTLDSLVLSDKKKVRVTELSHGQAQRVAIARAVLNQPPIILADEPTSALDDHNCDRVIHLLMEVAQSNNATLLVATHDQRLKAKIEKHVELGSSPILKS